MSTNKVFNDACQLYCDRRGFELISIYADYFTYKDNDGNVRQMMARELADNLYR